MKGPENRDKWEFSMKSDDIVYIENISGYRIPKRGNFIEDLYSRISKKITPLIAKTPLSPNQVTIISGFLGLTGALLLLVNEGKSAIIAGLLIQFFIVLDFVDGDLARMKEMCSSKGAWLDTFFDKLNDFVMIVCLTIGASETSGLNNIWVLGLVLMGTHFSTQFFAVYNKRLFDGVVTDSKSQAVKEEKNSINSIHSIFIRVGKVVGRHFLLEANTFWVILSICAFTNRLLAGLITLFALSILTLLFVILASYAKLASIGG